MNYFFVHLGEYPPWLYDSISSVKRVDSTAKIFLCGDCKKNIPDITNLNLKSIKSYQTSRVIDSELWKHDPNPLWRTSIYRVFILLDMMNYLNVNNFVHFDSDVILLEDFETIKKSINHHNKGLHITRCNDSEFVFGYSYCNSYNSLFEICSQFYKAIFNPVYLRSLITNFANEMQILNGIQKNFNSLIYELPTIPNKDSEYIFDPSSYGQYLYGTHNGDKAGWYGNHHYIGKLIGDNKLSVKMNNKPIANIGKYVSKIVNLHIHSKNTNGVLHEFSQG